jgi:3-deoxy-D-manno-octulosonic-acid transferase
VEVWNPGVHNVLEPATFVFQSLLVNYSHFAEAIALVNMEACTAINNQQELNAFENLIRNEDIRHERTYAALCANEYKALQQLF